MTEPKPSLSGIVRTVDLDGIRLTGCSIQSNVESVPQVSTQIDLSWKTVSAPREHPRGFDVVADMRFVVKTREDPATDLVTIVATYRLSYSLQEQVTPSADELTAFGESNAVFNVWPYWREFVQNSMARMGLPAVVLPVFRVGVSRDPAIAKSDVAT